MPMFTLPSRTFETPTAIQAGLIIGLGDVVVRATDTTTTSVEVRPSRPGRRADEEMAEGTTIRLVDGRLEVKTPKQRFFGMLGRPGGVVVTVDLPSGSDVLADTSIGDIDVTGSLERCRAKTHAGDVRIDDADVIEAQTSAGDVAVGRAGTTAALSTSAGDVSVEEVHGSARLKSSAGEIRVGTCSGDVIATAPYAQVRVREARSGSVTLTTSFGDIEVGVPEGTAAKLDVATNYGRIRNELKPSANPPDDLESMDKVTVTARTGYGQIVIRRP